jgi:hypothetical protein
MVSTPTRRQRKWMLIALGVQPLWALPVGGVLVWRWLAYDDENRRYVCTGQPGVTATCFEGDTTNMVLGLLYSTIGVTLLAVLVGMLVRWRRADRRQEALRERGRRTTAVITRVTATSVILGGKRVYRVRGEVPTVPGLMLDERTDHPLPLGTRLTVAYDPANPTELAVVDERSVRHGSVVVRVDAPQESGAD